MPRSHLPPPSPCLRHITPQFNYELVFEFIMPLSKRGRPITRCTPLAALQSQSLYLAPSHSISLPPFAVRFLSPGAAKLMKILHVNAKSAQFTFLTFVVYPEKEPDQLNRTEPSPTEPNRTEPCWTGLGVPQLPELCCCQRGFCAAVTTHRHTHKDTQRHAVTHTYTYRHTPQRHTQRQSEQ